MDTITVTQLREKLQSLEDDGFGDCLVWSTSEDGLLPIHDAITELAPQACSEHVELVGP